MTLGATSPIYSTRATDPSGSGTFITWVFGEAAMAVPASAAAATPAKARAGSSHENSSSCLRFMDAAKSYAAILNARLHGARTTDA